MQAGGWSNYQTPLRYIRDSAIANEGVILEKQSRRAGGAVWH
jgi:hypothetical protein